MRLMRGRRGWWCQGVGGRVALLPKAAVDEARGLADGPRQVLDNLGFDHPSAPDRYWLTVLTSTGCNLGCSYCFQNVGAPRAGRYSPPRIPAATLRAETIDAVLEFATEMMGRADLKELGLLLFGGEPLLNPRACLTLLRHLRDRGLTRGEMVSNGALLSGRLAAELSEAGLDEVQITFDGDRESHDRIRVTRRGGATFHRILDNVERASTATDLAWRFRINVSERTDSGVEGLIALLARSVDTSRSSIHFALVDDVGLGYTNDLGYEDSTLDLFIAWSICALEQGFSVPVSRPLAQCNFCSRIGGETGAVINADGTLFSCWETAGKRGYEVGHVCSGYDSPDQIASRWVACDYDVRPRRGSSAAFHDRVDAAILDWLLDHDRLHESDVARA